MTRLEPRTTAWRPRLTLRWPSINWPLVVLVVVLAGYWVFARSLERVDGNVILASIFLPDLTPRQAADASFNPLAVLLIEFLHPRVWRHLLPVGVGWWLAVEAAISLIQVLYDCPDRKTAAEFLRRQRRNAVNPIDLPIPVTPGTLSEARKESVLVRVGGPVRIQIPNGHAAVTERNARFLRILGPGVHDLGHFEYVQTVVDLRPQEEKAENISLLTREGIPLEADVSLVFRLNPGEEPVSNLRPYPYHTEAVRSAAYSGSVGEGGKASFWTGGPIGRVRGVLGALVSDAPIDELISAQPPHEAHHRLTTELTEKVWEGLNREGMVKPLRLRVSRLTPPETVSRQYTDYWLAVQRNEDQLARASGTAPLVQELETSRVEAEIMMIQAIVEGVRRAHQEAGENLSGYVLAVRLLEALREMFRYATEGLRTTGGEETSQLAADIENLSHKLTGLEERLKLPTPQFRPSRSD